jgi:Tol biopolymer transport system component
MDEPLTREERRMGRRLAAYLDARSLPVPASIADAIVLEDAGRRARGGLPSLARLAAVVIVSVIALALGGGLIRRSIGDTVVVPPGPTLPPPSFLVASATPDSSLDAPSPDSTSAAPPKNGPVLISYGGHIYLVDPNGTGDPGELAGPPGMDWGADWSPNDQRYLVLNGSIDGEPDLGLFVIDPQEGSTRRVTGTKEIPLRRVQDPVWSPDGARIAMRAELDGRPGIFVVDVDASRIVASTIGSSLHAPSWSPDGRKLALHAGEGSIAVWTLGAEQLASIVDVATVSDPVWAPDGWIYVTEFLGVNQPGFRGAVFRARADGTGSEQVTDPGAGRIDDAIAISRDGAFLTVSRVDQSGIGGSELCCGVLIRTIRTGEETLLHVGAGAVWSPDGRFLAGQRVEGSLDGQLSWIVVDRANGAARSLLQRPAFGGPVVGRELSWGAERP